MKKTIFLSILLGLVMIPSMSFGAEISEVEGCKPTFKFSPLTGKPCTTSTLPDGCEVGYLFSATTGKSCNLSTSPIITPVLPVDRIEKGILWIAGSSNSFQVTLANFSENSTVLEIDYPSNLKPAGITDYKCSGGICTDTRRFISSGGDSKNALSLSSIDKYEFVIRVFGETYTVDIPKGGEIVIFDRPNNTEINRPAKSLQPTEDNNPKNPYSCWGTVCASSVQA